MDQEARLRELEIKFHDLRAESQAKSILMTFILGGIIASTPDNGASTLKEAENLFNSFSLSGDGQDAVELDDLHAGIQSNGIRLVGLLRNAISVANAQQK